VASRLDSRIILDKQGAETLLGKGDMLYLHPKTSELIRAQGAYLSNQEIANVVNYIRSNASPDYSTELVQMSTVTTDGLDKDEFFDEAVRIVLEEKRGSVSLIQRKLAIGYGRASRIVEMMAECGILGGHKTAQAREVMITPEEWERIKGGEDIADIRRDALNSEYSSDEYEDEEIDLNEEDSIDED
jgi:S-DNA-T family DNA segregation ATPase FtsK/SpoIIIE